MYFFRAGIVVVVINIIIIIIIVVAVVVVIVIKGASWIFLFWDLPHLITREMMK